MSIFLVNTPQVYHIIATPNMEQQIFEFEKDFSFSDIVSNFNEKKPIFVIFHVNASDEFFQMFGFDIATLSLNMLFEDQCIFADDNNRISIIITSNNEIILQ
jgi:hypothetical protein